MGLLLPVGPRRMSSWLNHQRRTVPSTEPGTDWYCPIGTPIVAPADGVIFGSGNSIVPATGRWVGIDFDNGMRFRSMHHSRNVITSGRVHAGDVYAYSGASGYGVEDWSRNPATGGSHVHGTLWPVQRTRFGYHLVDDQRVPYTVDFMAYVEGADLAGSITLEDEMPLSDEDKAWMRLMVQQEVAEDSARLKVVEGAVARFPGGGAVQPRTDDLAVWIGKVMDQVAALPGASAVDEDALAAALAPRLASLLPSHTGTLTDDDLARISKAVADEQAKRLKD